MKILWICNIMLPVVAEHLGKAASHKEGWLTGLFDSIWRGQKENHIELGIAFPVEKELAGYQERVWMNDGELTLYGFYEKVNQAQTYDKALEGRMSEIYVHFQPDVIHCFGTEYGHTLAAVRACPDKHKVLVGIQGICEALAKVYQADIPENWWNKVTFRDFLRQDSLRQQQKKFAKRGKREKEVVQLAGNITGRTKWDHEYIRKWNPDACYFSVNETLRPEFYEGRWEEGQCEPYSIFVSQGDYPIKGLHYLLRALPIIREEYPMVKVRLAGDSLIKAETFKDRLKLSGYGKYLRSIIKEYQLQDQIEFLGRLTGAEMKKQYLSNSMYVNCSVLENSPNSLGEAMLLGMPCVASDTGGIPSLFQHEKDGLMFPIFQYAGNGNGGMIAEELAAAILLMWKNKENRKKYCENARLHAKATHDPEENYSKMMEMYANIGAK